MTGSFDDQKTKLIDCREYALVITIGMDGFADVQSTRISKVEAARVLRNLADAWGERYTV